MSPNEQRLHEQDWETIETKLTAFALGRIQKRSWHLAQDLAQTAVADLLAKPDSWEPAKEPLLKHLAKRVIGLAANEWHRKRTSFEVLVGRFGGDDGPDEVSIEEGADEVLHRRRVAARFKERLVAALAGDEDACLVVTWMMEGHETPLEIAKASRVELERVNVARRRVFYQAKIIAKEMGEELDAAEDALEASANANAKEPGQ